MPEKNNAEAGQGRFGCAAGAGAIEVVPALLPVTGAGGEMIGAGGAPGILFVAPLNMAAANALTAMMIETPANTTVVFVLIASVRPSAMDAFKSAKSLLVARVGRMASSLVRRVSIGAQ